MIERFWGIRKNIGGNGPVNRIPPIAYFCATQAIYPPQRLSYMKQTLTALATGLLGLLATTLNAQVPAFYSDYAFTPADTLRGSLRPERSCYDVTFYALHLRIQPEKRLLDGYVDIAFRAVTDFARLQLDLYENMAIEAITYQGKALAFERVYNAVFVNFPETVSAGTRDELRVRYRGKPTEAKLPPWDGGFVWSTDQRGRPWIGVACEGDGASLWWPNKDHLSDEPDSVLISVAVPKELLCIANGNLREVTEEGDLMRYDWFVSYPINNYNLSVNIGAYTHFNDTYLSQDGDTLALDYYVLDYNEQRARRHFTQTQSVLAAYEHYLGKYPFWEDGFALIETPYLGMEHQSGIAYGNKFMRGYLGGMIPHGMNWDYIIVHETGHEYFGNSISCNDLAEMWIHESFTTYLETLYVEHTLGYEEALRYIVSQRPFILNQEPILGPPGVNWENWKGSDHYFKGAWMLHTLRHALGDDESWFALFRDFYQENAISNVTTRDFVDFVNARTGEDWSAFFEQYLAYTDLPVLEYGLEQLGDDLEVRLRWKTDVPGFNMPVLVGTDGDWQRVRPATGNWIKLLLLDTEKGDFSVATDLFLIKTQRERD